LFIRIRIYGTDAKEEIGITEGDDEDLTAAAAAAQKQEDNYFLHDPLVYLPVGWKAR